MKLFHWLRAAFAFIYGTEATRMLSTGAETKGTRMAPDGVDGLIQLEPAIKSFENQEEAAPDRLEGFLPQWFGNGANSCTTLPFVLRSLARRLFTPVYFFLIVVLIAQLAVPAWSPLHWVATAVPLALALAPHLAADIFEHRARLSAQNDAAWRSRKVNAVVSTVRGFWDTAHWGAWGDIYNFLPLLTSTCLECLPTASFRVQRVPAAVPASITAFQYCGWRSC